MEGFRNEVDLIEVRLKSSGKRATMLDTYYRVSEGV